ncbi:uncharacterized protein LOC113324488 [Papaver somniferum]|uniref:uncharacterized protein LOC113324488 n=1 Tax=Papaver somniferum TaxID=3469 RepID=UPI000E6FB761|nr:uncharacterized protein LOC113324488 [Papaver somniferum]
MTDPNEPTKDREKSIANNEEHEHEEHEEYDTADVGGGGDSDNQTLEQMDPIRARKRIRSKVDIPEDRYYEQEDSSFDGDISAITDALLSKMIEKVISKKRSIEEKIDRLHRGARAPFKLNIREFRPPMNFQVPKLPEFDEKTDDPNKHVLHYETAMTPWQYNDELMCKMFPQSLTGGAITWFNQLPSQSIGTYHKLVDKFCSHYKYNRRDRKGCHALFLLGIRKEKSIRQFTRRFKQELADVVGANDQVVIVSYKQAYQYDQRGVYGSLVKRPPKTLEELYDQAEEYARVEDDSKARETREVNKSSNHPNDGKKDKSKNRSSGQHNDQGGVREKNQGERMETGYQKYHDMKLIPLNIRITELYEEISKDLRPPRPLPAETRDKRDKSKYYRSPANDRAGKLQEYVKKNFGKGSGQFGATHVINVSHSMIHSMTRRASEDETRMKLRQLKEWYVTNHIDFVSGNEAEILELECKKIEFSEEDMIGVYAPHNDDIFITAWIGMFRVHRILVDTGSSVSFQKSIPV